MRNAELAELAEKPNGLRAPRALRSTLTDTLEADFVTGSDLLDDDGEDRGGGNSEDRADEAPQLAADEQRDHDDHRTDADAALHDLRHEDVRFELVQHEKVRADH